MFKTKNIKTTLSLFAVIALASLTLTQSTPKYQARATASGGGPIVLDGMDPVCHAVYGEATDRYIAKVVKSVYDQSGYPSNNGKIAILGVSSATNAGGCGGNWASMLSTKFLTEFSTAPTVEFVNTSSELTTFFTGIASNAPRMMWIPDDWSRSGAVQSTFTANAEVIADFVNSGGGLFANHNTYGWLTSLLPSATFNNGGCNGGPVATADGTSDFGLTDTDVAACWHGYFTGSFGTLKTLAEWRYPDASTSPLVAVSIGGGEVSLPSSFTISISPLNPTAGTPLVITATAQTLAGVPQAGVVVSMTVSSGPDAGQTFTATTDSTGVATITVNTSSTGTNVYTATATVNGVSKTVSTTVTWEPAPTTIPAPTTTEPATTTTEPVTTTTDVVTTTTEVAPTTVAPATTSPAPTVSDSVAPAAQSPDTATPTTVHDHSSHSHGPLPSTGGDSTSLLQWAIILFGLGSCLVLVLRLRRYRA